jgi:hypothetical protein
MEIIESVNIYEMKAKEDVKKEEKKISIVQQSNT